MTLRGVAFEYEKIKLKYTVPQKFKTYTPDFILPNGIIVEVKGKFDRLTREKMLYVFEQHPERDIRLLFMRDNKIEKGSRTKYSDWCIKRGVKYHVSANGIIPEDWLAEGEDNYSEHY